MYRPLSQVPRPRSGFQMALLSSEDVLFIHGGFSKLKDANNKSEGRIHDDTWMLNLRSILTTTGMKMIQRTLFWSTYRILGSSSAGGKSVIDPNKANWQKVSKKGLAPSPRCGSVMTMYKNKAILFGTEYSISRRDNVILLSGGVHDQERERHTMLSTFFNDLFAFDLERRRWYQLGLRTPKQKVPVCFNWKWFDDELI